MPQDILGNTFVIQGISASEKPTHKGGITILPKNFMDKMGGGREGHDFPSKNCCFTVLRGGTLSYFRQFLVRKKIMKRRCISRFSVKNVLSHGAEKFRGGTFSCFRKILVWKKKHEK